MKIDLKLCCLSAVNFLFASVCWLEFDPESQSPVRLKHCHKPVCGRGGVGGLLTVCPLWLHCEDVHGVCSDTETITESTPGRH